MQDPHLHKPESSHPIDQMILHLWDHASDTVVITIEEL